MRILMLDSKDWKLLDTSIVSPKEIETIIKRSADEVRACLPDVSELLNIIVKPGLPHVAKEMGVGGSAYDQELIDITLIRHSPMACRLLRPTSTTRFFTRSIMLYVFISSLEKIMKCIGLY